MGADLKTRREAPAPAPTPTSKVPPLDLYRVVLLSIAHWAVGEQGKDQDRRFIMDQADEVVASLAGPGASPLVRLLAQRVGLALAEVSCLDSMYCSAVGGGELAEFRQRCRDKAHRRLMAACLVYDRVARDAGGFQFNLAVQQVNHAPARSDPPDSTALPSA